MGVAVLKIPYQCERCGEETYRLADYGNGEPIKKLAEYEDLEGQRRLLKLPCAVGDKIYEPRPDRGMVTEYRVSGLIYSGGEVFVGWQLNSGIYSNLDGVPANEIGKTVFLTREAAETALKELIQGGSIC